MADVILSRKVRMRLVLADPDPSTGPAFPLRASAPLVRRVSPMSSLRSVSSMRGTRLRARPAQGFKRGGGSGGPAFSIAIPALALSLVADPSSWLRRSASRSSASVSWPRSVFKTSEPSATPLLFCEAADVVRDGGPVQIAEAAKVATCPRETSRLVAGVTPLPVAALRSRRQRLSLGGEARSGSVLQRCNLVLFDQPSTYRVRSSMRERSSFATLDLPVPLTCPARVKAFGSRRTVRCCHSRRGRTARRSRRASRGVERAVVADASFSDSASRWPRWRMSGADWGTLKDEPAAKVRILDPLRDRRIVRLGNQQR